MRERWALGYCGCGAWLSCGKRDFRDRRCVAPDRGAGQQVPAALQLEMFASVAEFLEQALTSVLRNFKTKDCLDMGVLKRAFTRV